MARLRELRVGAHPFLLLAAWSAVSLVAALWLAVVPGDPSYPESGVAPVISAATLTAFFAVFIAAGSRLAWWLVIFFDVSAIVMSLVASLGTEVGVIKPVGLAVLFGTALWLIWTGSVEEHVLADGRERREPTPLH